MASSKHPLFVIHLHDATSLHFDFRLQIGNVMPSWAIPKGPTLDNTLKRLAMMTTDHSMEYRNFEGVLPEGQYGAGPVIIWDEGYYLPERQIDDQPRLNRGMRLTIDELEEGQRVMKNGFEKGEIKFFLHGKKLKGSFALVKTRGFAGKNAWLLIKHKDKYVKEGYDAKEFPKSVRSGKTIEQVK